MTTSEAASLLCSAGIELGPAVVRELVRRTEGWPVLLELAAVSLAGASDPVEAAMQLAGDDYLISSYFRDELLAELPASTLHFLTRCSVLERMSGPLCDTVLGSAWSVGVLAGLELTNIPLAAADASHGWYRLHGLFREMLMSELRRSEPELAHSLHARAADWHGRAGSSIARSRMLTSPGPRTCWRSAVAQSARYLRTAATMMSSAGWPASPPSRRRAARRWRLLPLTARWRRARSRSLSSGCDPRRSRSATSRWGPSTGSGRGRW